MLDWVPEEGFNTGTVPQANGSQPDRNEEKQSGGAEPWSLVGDI